MPRCAGSKPNGTPCERIVGASQRYCFSHDPGRRAERRRNAARAGRSRPGGELGEVQNLLREITDRVLDGEMSTTVGIAVNQILNTRVRLIEVRRRVQEQEELLQRLVELEDRAALVGGGRRA